MRSSHRSNVISVVFMGHQWDWVRYQILSRFYFIHFFGYRITSLEMTMRQYACSLIGSYWLTFQVFGIQRIPKWGARIQYIGGLFADLFCLRRKKKKKKQCAIPLLDCLLRRNPIKSGTGEAWLILGFYFVSRTWDPSCVHCGRLNFMITRARKMVHFWW